MRSHQRPVLLVVAVVWAALTWLPDGFSLTARLCAGDSAAGSSVLREVGMEAGIALPGVVTEALAWGDYDADGDQDLYLAVAGRNRLFQNEAEDGFRDVTEETGVGHASHSVSAAFADFDNDGDLDLYVVNVADPALEEGEPLDALYRNDGARQDGSIAFSEIAGFAGVRATQSSGAVSFLDFDHDGRLDIFVSSDGPGILYHNQGSTFQNVALERGINGGPNGAAAAAGDFDGDGLIDLYTAWGAERASALYLNRVDRFEDVAGSRRVNAQGSAGAVAAFDFDNDLDLDLYWLGSPAAGPRRENALFENQGDLFVDVTAETETADPLGLARGASAGDIDNDGWLDLFVANRSGAETGASALLCNLGGERFEAVRRGFAGDLRGAAYADYDQDGDLDLALAGGVGQPNLLFRNDSSEARHFVEFRLVGTTSNRSAIGARVVVETEEGVQLREVSGGSGSQNSLPLEFGLGAAEMIREVRVTWPSGSTQTFRDIVVDVAYLLREVPIEELILRRGDANGDGAVDLSDSVRIFGRLFLGEAAFSCAAAADTNHDGSIDLSDGVMILQVLFRGAGQPFRGFGECVEEEDPLRGLTCEQPSSC